MLVERRPARGSLLGAVRRRARVSIYARESALAASPWPGLAPRLGPKRDPRNGRSRCRSTRGRAYLVAAGSRRATLEASSRPSRACAVDRPVYAEDDALPDAERPRPLPERLLVLVRDRRPLGIVKVRDSARGRGTAAGRSSAPARTKATGRAASTSIYMTWRACSAWSCWRRPGLSARGREAGANGGSSPGPHG